MSHTFVVTFNILSFPYFKKSVDVTNGSVSALC